MGYSAVLTKSELIDYQISKTMRFLILLNVKYLTKKKEGREFPVANPDVNGNAWFAAK
jgi:hypothetical protein